MARVAKIKGEVFQTVTVVENTVEYALSAGAKDGDIRVTPVLLGTPRNTDAFEIPAVVADALRIAPDPKGK